MLGALLLGGWYGGLAGSIGMTIADLMDPVYITGAPKTFIPVSYTHLDVYKRQNTYYSTVFFRIQVCYSS